MKLRRRIRIHASSSMATFFQFEPRKYRPHPRIVGLRALMTSSRFLPYWRRVRCRTLSLNPTMAFALGFLNRDWRWNPRKSKPALKEVTFVFSARRTKKEPRLLLQRPGLSC